MIRKIKHNGITYLNLLSISYNSNFFYFCIYRYGIYFYYFKKPILIIKWD